MDEMQLIRSLYAETPAPTRHEIIAARRKLDALAKPRRWRRARRYVGGVGLVAAAAAVAVVVAQLGMSGAGPTSTPSSSAQPARHALLSAAESAKTKSFSSGKYWFVETELGGPNRVQGKAGSYFVEARQGRQDWTYAYAPRRTLADTIAGNDANPEYYGDADLGAKPVGAKNVAAWRRDGSPTHWTIPVPNPDGSSGQPIELDTKATPWVFHRKDPPAGAPFGDETLKDLQALPTDPDLLRAELLKQKTTMDDTREDWQTDEQWLFEIAGSMLEKEPAPPKVRAAAFKVLADLKTARFIGTITDPLGRKGVAVEMRTEPGHADRYIVDPDSGRMIADEDIVTDDTNGSSTGTMENWEALVKADFTNQVPTNAPPDH